MISNYTTDIIERCVRGDHVRDASFTPCHIHDGFVNHAPSQPHLIAHVIEIKIQLSPCVPMIHTLVGKVPVLGKKQLIVHAGSYLHQLTRA